MRGSIVDPAVRFDLDDPASSYAPAVGSDQSGAKKGGGGRQSVVCQPQTRVDDLERGTRGLDLERLAQVKAETRSPGSIHDSSGINAGNTVSWMAPAMWDWLISRSCA